jgi:hypothetical protein
MWPYLLSVVTLVIGAYLGHLFTMRQYRVQKTDASQFGVATAIDDLLVPYLPYLTDVLQPDEDDHWPVHVTDEQAEEMRTEIGRFLPRLADETLRNRVRDWLREVDQLRSGLNAVRFVLNPISAEEGAHEFVRLMKEHADIRLALGKYHH